MAPGRPRSLRALAFGSKRNESPGPPSPTFSEATNVSAMNFGANGPSKIITRANLKASIQAYEELMSSSATYRAALIALSKATAAFADAIEVCSGLKGPTYESGSKLQAASGLHHLVGNHWHVLAETLDRKFEKPLRQHLDNYRTVVNDRSASYERALREKSQAIRDTEARNLNKKSRNLQSFREALSVLQRQVDDLDELKALHYQEILEHEEEVWDVVAGKVSLVVRSSMDIFDRFTSKASDPVIEPMLQSIPDPFDSYGPPQAEDQIFSILPPLGIMASTPSSSSHTPSVGTPVAEEASLPATSSQPNTWASTSSEPFPTHSPEWADAASPTSSLSPSTSPPGSMSPTRRHSYPAVERVQASHHHHHRKSDLSKLRSVLSAIEEKSPSVSDPSLPTLSNGDSGGSGSTLKASKSEKRPEQSVFSWSSPLSSYGKSPSEADVNVEDTMTPRRTEFASVPNPPPPDPDGTSLPS